ncbi:hypothetical protein RHECNPAF_2190041 [Rhizobium etli CNPAF512]|nr:hypothetical protein RHECNPAF_2190041 [Rhizobium etli CNPAF512]
MLRPEPSREGDGYRNCSPDYRPRGEDRADQHDAGGDRRQERPDRIGWHRFPRFRLGGRNAADDYFASVEPEACGHRQGLSVRPEWCGGSNNRDVAEIVGGRGRGCGPFQRRGVPGVRPCERAEFEAAHRVDEEDEEAGSQDDGAETDEKVQACPGQFRRIGIDASRHALQAEDVHREEGQVKAGEDEAEGPSAEPFAHHAAGDLREPVVDRADEREDGTADQHVMKMCDDEISIVNLRVERHGGHHQAGHSADDEGNQEADDEKQRCLEDETSVPQRRQPAEDLRPGRNGDRHAGGGEEAASETRQTGNEHVMDPKPESQNTGRDHRQDKRQIAENRAPGEGRDHGGHHADGGQEDDVNLRVAKEPEQVLPEKDVAAFRGIVELCTDQPVENERRGAEHDRRHGQNDEKGRHQHRPDEERNAIERHARCPQLEDGHDDFDGDGKGGYFGEGDHLCPEVHPLSRAILRTGQRHVREPANIGGGIESQRDPEKQPPGQKYPIGEGIQPWKGDVARSDHQRNKIDRHCLHHRHGEKEHHVAPVYGENLVITVGADEARLRESKLQAHRQRKHAAEEQEDEGCRDITPPDDLVIDRGQCGQQP